MFDVLIKNGRIVDGSGNPWYSADVAIKDGKIVSIRKHIAGDAARVIDAKGMVVSPGFIDVHTHSDYSIVAHNQAHSSIYQGVTTEGAGQCGGSVFPLNDSMREWMQAQVAAFSQKSMEEVGPASWSRLSEWKKIVSGKGTSNNIAPYVGHGSVRTFAMGFEGKGGERVVPTAEEMAIMKAEVRKAMEDGAFGMSTGLRYVPGRNARTEEVIELSKVVAEYGGIYISHMRSEEEVMLAAITELCEISEKAGIRASASHHKAMFPENWGKVNESLRILDRARARGVEVMCDFYPWPYARELNLGGDFREVMPKGGGQDVPAILTAIKDDKTWEEMKSRLHANFADEVAKNDERKRALKKDGIAVADIWDPETFDYVVYSKTQPEIVFKNFRQIADMRGIKDYWDAMREVYIRDEGVTYIAAGGMSEDDIVTILKYPGSAVSTDSWSLHDSPSMMDLMCVAAPHPRAYGTYPLILDKYVREMKVITLEDAVRKMSSLPAEFLGLSDRGFVRTGHWADIVVFDPATVKNLATWGEPTRHPAGIPYVLVNGVVTIDDGKHTGALGGKVLERP
jgi:N-acyl-D-amino-acid deacylase